MSKRLPIVVAIGAILVLLLAQTASAAIARNTIDPDGSIAGHYGRVLVITGPIECTEGDTLRIFLEANQDSTGAFAVGTTRLQCTGELQQWTARLFTLSFASFEEGLSEVCAFGLTRNGLEITDTRQWCAANGVVLHGGR